MKTLCKLLKIADSPPKRMSQQCEEGYKMQLLSKFKTYNPITRLYAGTIYQLNVCAQFETSHDGPRSLT